MTSKPRGTGPRVTWAGVVVKLDDGRTVALEFDGTTSFVTADVHTVKPWDQLSTNKFQDEARVVIQGNGRVWTEGAGYGPTVVTPEVEAMLTPEARALATRRGRPQRAIEGEVVD